MLTKTDTIRVRKQDVEVVINCNVTINNRVIVLNFSCNVDGKFIVKSFKTVTHDQNFYRQFKQFVDEKLTIADVVETRLKNKGFVEVVPDAPNDI